MTDKLVCGVSTFGDTFDSVNRLVDTNATAAGLVMSKLVNDIADATILVSGDSTGNASDEWVRLYTQALADKYPAFSVDYYLWDDGSSDYLAVEAVSVGTGLNTLSIYNASISGSKPDYIQGSRLSAAVLNIPQCDLFILNHGHNMINSYTSDEVGLQRSPQYLEAIETVKHINSNCGVIMVAQNPRRDDNEYQIIYNTIIDTAGLIGSDVADVYSLFIVRGKNPLLFADNVHPSTGLGEDSGTQLYLDAILSLHNSVVFKGSTSSFDNAANNLLINGDFAAFGGAIPDGWTGTNATATKDTVNKDGLNGYAVDVAPTVGGSASLLNQTLGGDLFRSLRGGWVTLAVRVYIPLATATNSAGRISVSTNSFNSTYTQSSEPRDGFQWRCVSLKILSTDTFAQVKVYGDTGAGNGQAVFGRAVLVRGRLPRDII